MNIAQPILRCSGGLLAVYLTMVVLPSSEAGTYTWDASGGAPLNDGPGNWNPTGGSNWYDGAAFGPWGDSFTDTAIIGAGNGSAGTINVGSINVNSITFAAPGSGNYTLSGGTITFGGSNATLMANGGTSSTISSTIAGTSGFIKKGDGTVYISGNNTYTGITQLVDWTGGGETVMMSDTAFGNSVLMVGNSNNGYLSSIGALNGTRTITNQLTFHGSDSFNLGTATNDDRLVFTSDIYDLPDTGFHAGNSTTWTGSINASAPLQLHGGILTLKGDSPNFDGGVRLWASAFAAHSTLVVGHDNALGTSGEIYMNAGMLQYGPGVTRDFSDRFNNSGGRAYTIHTGGNNVTFSTALTPTSGSFLYKLGKGRLTLNSANASTFVSGVRVYNGELCLDFSNMATPTDLVPGANNLDLFGGTLVIKGKPGLVATSQNLSGGNLNISWGQGACNGLILDANGGPGVSVTFNDQPFNRDTGNVLNIDISNGGTIFSSAAASNFPDAWITVKDATGIGFGHHTGTQYERIASVPLTAGNNNDWGGGNFTFYTSGNLVRDGGGHGNYCLVMDATASAGSLDLNGGVLQGNGFLLAGDNDYSITNGSVITGGWDSMFHTMGAGTLTIAAQIDNDTILTKNGPGTLLLSGAKNYVNGTRLLQGTLAGNNDLSFGTGQIIVAGDAAIRSDANMTVANNLLLVGRNLGDNTRWPDARYLTVNTNGNNMTMSGVISGGGGLIKSGSGVLTLSGTNTYLGGTTISGGTLAISTDANLGHRNYTAMTINGGTLRVTGTSLNNLNTRAVNWNTFNGGLDIADANNTFTVASPISGAGSLTKSGVGTLALSGVNTYSGATNVNAGKLVVSGSINGTSQVNVNGGVFNYTSSTGLTRNVVVNGGNFKYNSSSVFTGTVTMNSGTVSGSGNLSNTAFTIGSGVTLAPGNSPGTSNTGTQTWAGLGTYQWELNEVASSGGTKGNDPGWDWANITGNLNITATSGSKFTIDIVGLNLSNSMGTVVGFDNTQNYTWTLATFSGSVSGFDPSVFNLLTTNFVNNNALGGGSFSVTQAGNSVNLNFTAVPEPTAGLLLILGTMALKFIRRTRR